MVKVRAHRAQGVTSINGTSGAVIIGGSNLLLKSGAEKKSSSYLTAGYHTTLTEEELAKGNDYTITACITPGEGITQLIFDLQYDVDEVAYIPVTGVEKQIVHASFKGKIQIPGKAISPTFWRVPRDNTSPTTIHWAVLTAGNTPVFSWFPAQEDTESRLAAIEAKLGISYEPPVVEGPDFDDVPDSPEILMGGVILPLNPCERGWAA